MNRSGEPLSTRFIRKEGDIVGTRTIKRGVLGNAHEENCGREYGSVERGEVEIERVEIERVEFGRVEIERVEKERLHF